MTFAGHGGRSPDRTNHRNGRRDQAWETRAGRIDLEIPKLPHGAHLPSFLEPRRSTEKASVAVIREASVKEISARSLDDLIEATGGEADEETISTAFIPDRCAPSRTSRSR